MGKLILGSAIAGISAIAFLAHPASTAMIKSAIHATRTMGTNSHVALDGNEKLSWHCKKHYSTRLHRTIRSCGSTTVGLHATVAKPQKKRHNSIAPAY